MTRRRPNRQAGLTLIELLASLGIVGVLAALSVANFNQYQKLAYDTTARRVVQDQKTALEAGRVSLDDRATSSFLYAWASSPGPVTTSPDFVPGLVNPKYVSQYVYFDESCASGASGTGWCAVDGGYVSNSRGKKSRWWWRMRNGQEGEWSTDL